MRSPLHALPRRTFLKTTLLAATSMSARIPIAQPSDTLPHVPACARIPNTALDIRGPVQRYLNAVSEQWLKPAPFSNPAMLEMFRDRDRRPLREMVPWAGEFAGKYLTSAIQVWRVTRDPSLKSAIADFVKRLVPLQEADGYLGPWPKGSHLTGHARNVGEKGGDTWDAWGHYHVLLGLLLWHEDTADPAALDCARRIGDLFCKTFETARLVDTGSTEMNLAPIHALCLLHRRTSDPRYLNLALKICDEFSDKSAEGKPLAGDYLNAALERKEFFQMPKPRWESLHPIMGLAELYWITGDARYRRAFEQIWWSIVKLDRHNNGGFSSGEQAQGNPYHQGVIETCCTIAWTALSVEMLKMTANSIVADELELSTLNSILGLHSPNGRWCTYNTPMDGVRKASAHDIVFQARAGSPELNCCSVNGARGLGMISDWAVMESADGAVLLNWFGPCRMTVPLKAKGTLSFEQITDYPRDNHVQIKLDTVPAEAFELKLRIPHWSKETRVTVNNEKIEVSPGTYLSLKRKWVTGDVIDITFDFRFRFWAGERECADKASIYRGPILLTYDRRFNEFDPDNIPSLDAAKLNGRLIESTEWIQPMLLVEVGSEAEKVRLCDFASAGVGGSPYVPG